MRWLDLFTFATTALLRNKFRTSMILLSMTIGIAAILILTGIGEGARLYIVNEFSSLGSNTLVVLPGKKETSGSIAITGAIARDVTMEDADALLKLSDVENYAPIVIGASTADFAGKKREILTIGTNRNYFSIRDLSVKQGNIFPDYPNNQLPTVCLIGKKLKDELFRGEKVLGQWLKVGERRYRVIGVIGDTGAFGMDMSDAVFLPINHAQTLFNTDALFRVIIQLNHNADQDKVKKNIEQIMKARHNNEEDVTIVSPDSLLSAFESVLNTMTAVVGGIGAISLLVAGILITNVTIISVSQRTYEIGLLKALGSNTHEIRKIFLTEAGLMSLSGGLLGVSFGMLTLNMMYKAFPSIPFAAPVWIIVMALIIALITGVLFALVPANKAAKMQPLDALMSQ